MTNKSPKISLIIPAYHEEKKIEKDICEAFKFFHQEKLFAEVIVSTDRRTDPTNQIVEKMQKEFTDLYLITGGKKVGKGAALKKAIAVARGKIIFFADAGYCVPFKHLLAGLELLSSGCHLALGSRALSRSRVVKSQPFYRQLGSLVFGKAIYVLGVPATVSDTQCGFKVFRRPVAKKLFAKLRTPGFMFDIEIILLAKKYHYKLAEFPVNWTSDPDTKFKPISGGLKDLLELARIKFLFSL